jgi:hypothetical protein
VSAVHNPASLPTPDTTLAVDTDIASTDEPVETDTLVTTENVVVPVTLVTLPVDGDMPTTLGPVVTETLVTAAPVDDVTLVTAVAVVLDRLLVYPLIVTVPVVVFTLTSNVASLPLNSMNALGVTPAGIVTVALPVESSVTVVINMFCNLLQTELAGSNTANT